jgi:hypothetical protein
MSDDLRILIVTYLSSPDQGIGANRWYSLAERLTENATVDLLTNNAPNALRDGSNAGYRKIHYFNSRYPNYLSGENLSLIGKLKYRLRVFFESNIRLVNPFDRSAFDEEEMSQALDDLCANERYDCVIVTGAPFMLSYLVAKYCQGVQQRVWVDWRDPWTWASAYGMSLLSAGAKKRQLQMQDETVAMADCVSVPVEPMYRYLFNRYSNFRDKILHLPHGFDGRLSKRIGLHRNTKPSMYSFIYGGTVYDGTEAMIQKWVLRMDELKIDYHLDIYAFNAHSLRKEAALAHPSIRIHDPVEKAELFEKILDSSAYIAFFPSRYKDLFSTKFIEIISLKRPVLLIAEEGELSTTLTAFEAVVHVKPNELNQLTLASLDKLQHCEVDQSKLADYEFGQLSSQILSRIRGWKH